MPKGRILLSEQDQGKSCRPMRLEEVSVESPQNTSGMVGAIPTLSVTHLTHTAQVDTIDSTDLAVAPAQD